jgi:hypothetical protein
MFKLSDYNDYVDEIRSHDSNMSGFFSFLSQRFVQLTIEQIELIKSGKYHKLESGVIERLVDARIMLPESTSTSEIYVYDKVTILLTEEATYSFEYGLLKRLIKI